jgi:hypothetical protein
MREITFGTDGLVRLTGTSGGEVEAVTTDGWRDAWVAHLIKVSASNPLNLRWFRKFERPYCLTMGTRRYRLREGFVYEVESAGPGGEPRLHAFQVKHGDVAWAHCLTLDKRGGTERVMQALE